MSKRLNAFWCEPFELGWPSFRPPQPVDNFQLSPAQAAARDDLELAGFVPLKAAATRFVAGEALYWSAILHNATHQPQNVTLDVAAEGGRAFVWYQHPWYTSGVGLLPEPRARLVPELLLKHDRIEKPADIYEGRSGLSDHADAEAALSLHIPPGGFRKVLIKVLTDAAARPLKGALRVDGLAVLRFSGTPVRAPAGPVVPAWCGLYYGLVPGSSSPLYAVDDLTFERDLAYLQELGLNTLVIGAETLSQDQFTLLARHGLRRVVLRTDDPAGMRAAMADARKAGVEVLFYTQDEPHHSREALREHLRRSRRIRAAGGRSFTAISAALDAERYIPSTLDVPNVALWSLTPATKLRGVYYWQAAFERPGVNRYLAGLFAHHIEAPGFVPFVYRDGYPQDAWQTVFEQDTSPLYKDGFRNHFLAYPSRTGPIRTLQGEALAQGLADWRVLDAARRRFPAGFGLLMRQLAPRLRATLRPEVLQAFYNGRGPTPDVAAASVLAAEARQKALALLEHATKRLTTVWPPVPLEGVSVAFDAARASLSLAPANLTVENFPLCLIEGFGAGADEAAIARELFGVEPAELESWTLSSWETR